MDNPLISNLKHALDQNPENIPLRLSLAQLLLESYNFSEAEEEYRKGLSYEPHNTELKIGLSEAFLSQGKISAALVVCEEVIEKEIESPRAFLVYARVLNEREEYSKAAEMYKKAKELNKDVHDETLESLLFENSIESLIEPERSREYVDGDPNGKFVPYRERSKITFADVGGMEDLKEEIKLKIIHPITNPEIYAAYGKKTGGGILLYGPPGCGKTYIARATAGETNASFISVGISDILNMYTGQSERNLHDVFESARANKPVILFFDEVDALGASRRDMRQSAGRQVINQFLAELDGIDSDNDGILVLAATNAPWHLDGAFRRPGRFDRIIFVPPPDDEARSAILKVLLHDKPAHDVDVAPLVNKTEGFSGADLKAIVEMAIEEKLKLALKSGNPEPLTTRELLKVSKKIKATTKRWFTTAKNHALYANENGLYDDILTYLRLK